MIMQTQRLTLPDLPRPVGTGWLRSPPDMRDYHVKHDSIKPALTTLGLSKKQDKIVLPDNMDLSDWCSPIEDQGQIGSCTAQAAVGIAEYFQNRVFGQYTEGSRLFVYKTTRKLMGWEGDTGAFMRSAMGALRLCGIAPEKYWQYTDDPILFDEEPPAFVYSVADNFEATHYFCHDPIRLSISKDEVLNSVKSFIASGVPSMFGFWIFDSFYESERPGDIPMPGIYERNQGGHAVVAIGYDDDYEIVNTFNNQKTKGAIKIRNSWGESWGNQGYGWLPYDYVLAGLADEFWSLFDMDWIDTDEFGLE
ncbi:C1 family peptidase [Pleionea sp. CnH1-48]|uniref:C1 family peptidase n=1 Tax=Pleionea sp. CnH1-48 TaxID=2954494 RepID=UPI0020974141|nr:C1 family peptidase [Pleionea sp. CnH1-48]MCO7226932.1 hypothetical protein [Pleionea sp. CnH1-48]